MFQMIFNIFNHTILVYYYQNKHKIGFYQKKLNYKFLFWKTYIIYYKPINKNKNF